MPKIRTLFLLWDELDCAAVREVAPPCQSCIEVMITRHNCVIRTVFWFQAQSKWLFFFFLGLDSTSNTAIVQVSSSMMCVCSCVRACARTRACVCVACILMGHLKRQRASRSEENSMCICSKKKQKKRKKKTDKATWITCWTMSFFVFKRSTFKQQTGLPLYDFRDPGWVELGGSGILFFFIPLPLSWIHSRLVPANQLFKE